MCPTKRRHSAFCEAGFRKFALSSAGKKPEKTGAKRAFYTASRKYGFIVQIRQEQQA
jgi:hypothetical protein